MCCDLTAPLRYRIKKLCIARENLQPVVLFVRWSCPCLLDFRTVRSAPLTSLYALYRSDSPSARIAVSPLVFVVSIGRLDVGSIGSLIMPRGPWSGQSTAVKASVATNRGSSGQPPMVGWALGIFCMDTVCHSSIADACASVGIVGFEGLERAASGNHPHNSGCSERANPHPTWPATMVVVVRGAGEQREAARK